MRLTKLTQSAKSHDKYFAEFEDGETLAVTVALIADYSLFTGRELSGDEYAALRSDAAGAKAKARALRILGKRSMSRREITDRLVQKGESEETAEETADWLQKIGAVNDGEYAALIVRHYAGNGYGKMRIRDELRRRGIDRALWEDALAGLPETEDKVYAVLRAKLGGKNPDKAALKRATDALYRRGFSWDEIKTAVERYINEVKDLADDE
ncbi:regulatory protein [Sporobacter termitidis DSM 10068]|uniref:Regulatory protein RecX n=1 Tax=Sporobacter termitidis DSM 10068 TaxID=1123282 RepID=A0A1M5YVX9_9FIRM|nr:regulatory protein RecX [Sporobacter termitidis]SHI16232.1 regulatory protein [Sporobacter termitidis DSM 10068]